VPELPEVETVVRTLRPQVVGQDVQSIWTSGKALRLGRPVDTRALRKHAVGGRIVAVRRRAKYVVMDVALPDGTVGTSLVHLGMSGRLRVQAPEQERPTHTHVVWILKDGREIRFSDPRRFGLVKAAPSEADHEELAALGPDPLLDLSSAYLEAELVKSRAPIKAFLLDQSRIAGLGNIYVCEAMFLSGLHPLLPANRAKKRSAALFEAIQQTLREALAHGGTTLRDFVNSEGHSGQHQHALWVYGREGDPCHKCQTPIMRRVDGGRSTFFCRVCQKR
jgi:formamidopyrimidine-DNA glycosylase